MRVIEVPTYDGPGALREVERPDPVPTDGKVRVRVSARAVNPADAATAAGVFAARTPNATLPVVLGWDFAGVLLDDAPSLPAGRRVTGMYPWFALGDGSGTYTEIVLADPAWLAALPDGADPGEAATLAMNGQTALQALRIAAPTAGRTLLVTGASGAVGGFAVQLAAAEGVHVIAVASAGDEEYVGALGAKEVIGRADLATIRDRYPDGVDAVLDAGGAGADGPGILGAVRDGGVFVAVSDPWMPAAERGIRVATVHTEPEADGLADLVDRWTSGRLQVRVAESLPLADAAEAFRRLAAGSLRGKLVLTS